MISIDRQLPRIGHALLIGIVLAIAAILGCVAVSRRAPEPEEDPVGAWNRVFRTVGQQCGFSRRILDAPDPYGAFADTILRAHQDFPATASLWIRGVPRLGPEDRKGAGYLKHLISVTIVYEGNTDPTVDLGWCRFAITPLFFSADVFRDICTDKSDKGRVIASIGYLSGDETRLICNMAMEVVRGGEPYRGEAGYPESLRYSLAQDPHPSNHMLRWRWDMPLDPAKIPSEEDLRALLEHLLDRVDKEILQPE